MSTNKKPMQTKKDVQSDNDPHIDQDFEGYPNLPANKKMIKPQTKTEKKTAGTGIKDGEKDKPEAGGKI